MTWEEILKGALVSLACFGSAFLLIRSARRLDRNREQERRREQNRTKFITPKVVVMRRYCQGGIHYANTSDFAPGSDSCDYCVRMLTRESSKEIA